MYPNNTLNDLCFLIGPPISTPHRIHTLSLIDVSARRLVTVEGRPSGTSEGSHDEATDVDLKGGSGPSTVFIILPDLKEGSVDLSSGKALQ